MPEPIIVHLQLESEKVHSYKYKGIYPQPDKTEPSITSIYIAKSAMDGKAWPKISVEVREVK